MGNFEPKIVVKNEGKTSAEFVIEPLQHTVGHTIGNALRRVLLSNIEGAAVTSIKISGVTHEFQTIDGVREDVTAFMLNLRNLFVKMDIPFGDSGVRVIKIDKKGKGVITGADIQCPPEVTIENPDLYLCDITDDNAEFKVDMTVEKGYGFVLPEKQHIVKDVLSKENNVIGIIPMASVFTPVIKVSYEVEPTRVGLDAKYERLIINVETNGTINPVGALVEAAGILIKQFNLIRSFAGEISEFGFAGDEFTGDGDLKLNTRIDDLEFGHRTANCLRRENVQYVRDLVVYSESDLLKLRSFGRKSLDEVIAKLREMGLELKH